MRFSKKRIEDFIKGRGFKTLTEFAQACHIDVANVYKNVNGSIRPGIDRLFVYAHVLQANMEQMITLFYPEEQAVLVDEINRASVALSMARQNMQKVEK